MICAPVRAKLTELVRISHVFSLQGAESVMFRVVRSLCLLLALSLPTYAASQGLPVGVAVRVVEVDPAAEVLLGNQDNLSARLDYDSDRPLRFVAIGSRDASVLRFGAIRNVIVLHPSGEGDALVSVRYNNPTHIDALTVIVMDEEWNELGRLNYPLSMKWSGKGEQPTRRAAAWIKDLTRSEQSAFDYVYDPEPFRYGTLYDFTFFLCFAAIPFYLLLQSYMLWKYRYRWRELAFIPIFPYLILGFYYLFGLEIETSLQVMFLFRYTFFALLYLVALWLAKRFWQHKLPPPKLYKQPKID
jgi:hypothetical protein